MPLGSFVLGFFEPVICLPDKLADSEKAFILAHEKTHIKRRDYLIKPFAYLVLCIHWMNPLVWAAFYYMNRDMEMSCDENVIRMLGEEKRKEYSHTLLHFATANKDLAPSLISFGEGPVKGRIHNVLKYHKPAFWITVVGTILVLALAAGLLVNPKSASAEKVDSQFTTIEEVDHLYVPLNKEDAQTVIETYQDLPSEETKESVFQEMESEVIETTMSEITLLEKSTFEEDPILLNTDIVASKEIISYQNPCPAASRISDTFGTRRHPITGEDVAHNGVDLAAEEGADVLAAAAGTVASTGNNPTYGNYIVLLHSDGRFTYYTQCKEIIAKQGEDKTYLFGIW